VHAAQPPRIPQAIVMTPRAILRIIAWNVVVLAGLLIVIEGASSWVLFVRDQALKRQYVAERRHTTYDPELGWVNEPGVFIRDMYGPGVSLRTNRQRFRNDADVQKAVPDGKRRLIVSGDSFAFGFGVDNDHTWSQRLASLDGNVEVVNMGQGGYGFDQAYLWFKRDGAALDRQAHLMAFIDEDFDRMQYDTFVGYGKPVLDVDPGDDAALVVRNVPVPPVPYAVRWPALHLDNLRSLRTVDLLGRLQRAIRPRTPISFTSTWADAKMDDILRLILEDLKRMNDAHGSRLVLVRFVRHMEIRAGRQAPPVEMLARHARAMDIPFIDLAPDFQSLTDQEIDRLFIKEGQVDYLGAAGHLNEPGNEFVARRLHEKLATILTTSAPVQ
jgi:hypothetical protein